MQSFELIRQNNMALLIRFHMEFSLDHVVFLSAYRLSLSPNASVSN